MTDPWFRPAQRHQSMICFDDGPARFQMRAAGIAMRNGRVMVQNVMGDRLRTFPGGRIDQGESSAVTVVREFREEFGVEVAIGPIVFVVESFFNHNLQAFHEISFYFPVLNPEILPYADDGVCYRFKETRVEIEYRWIEASPEGLAAGGLLPIPLRTRLGTFPSAVEHIVDRKP
jgi:8-oxo-dGTP pyrophosphatase MutT (NUDIX family)